MSRLKLLLLSAAAAIVFLGSPAALSATAGADAPHPYFCGKTFTLFVMRGEKVSESEQDRAAHLLSTPGGDFVFRETDAPLPAGAKPVRDDQGVKLFRVMGGVKLIGYTIAVDDAPLKVLVTGRSFTGKARDLDFLTRFNFHRNRPQCKASSQ